jgi:GYF domain 2/Family of unknown function (DUF5362)
MKIWIARDGQKYGPYELAQVEAWVAQGKLSQGDLAWSQGQQWRPLGDLLRDAGCVIPPPPPSTNTMPFFSASVSGSDDEATIRRIADYEKASGILWIVVGALQCLTLIGLIAGIWNIYAGLTRLRLCPLILERNSRVPAAFEGVGQLIIIGIINLCLGGMIGVAFVIFDFFIRDLVLRHRHLFHPVAMPDASAATFS